MPSFPASNQTFLKAPLPEGSQSTPSLKRSRVHSVGVAGPDPGPSSIKKSKGLDTGITDPRVTLTQLKRFPQLHAQVLWAKGLYRSQCIVKLPYSDRVKKLALANEVYGTSLARIRNPIAYDDAPERGGILALVSSLCKNVATANILEHAR